MTLDPRFVLLAPIQEQLIDKTTGLAMAGGIVSFFEDSNRTVPKNVYTLAGTYPSYTYVSLGSVLTLSSIGTYVDGSGNNIIPYLFPYEGSPSSSTGAIDLYYITVTNSALVPQFTVAAWPNIAANNNIATNFADTENELSNPQFVVVDFPNSNPYTISTTLASATFPIAPGWDLILTGTGTYGCTIKQTAVTTTQLSNPPFCLEFTAWSGSVTSAILRQTISQSSRLFANGFISSIFYVASTDSIQHNYSMNYVPSNVLTTPTLLASGSSTSPVFNPINNTVKITSINPDNAPTGSIDIQVVLPIGGLFQITSLQIAGVQNLNSSTEFIELTAARQIDQLYHYYNLPLQFKPIPSYLVGWDFPLNPNQVNLVTPQNLGVNTGYYTWDQTLLYQSVTSGINTSRDSVTGSIVLTASATTQMAAIQYLLDGQCQDILFNAARNNLSVNINVASTVAQVMTVSLWWNATPIGASGSTTLITTIDANGKPATLAAGWNEIKCIYGNATFTTVAGANTYTTFSFPGFQDTAAYLTGKSFAIVVGTSSVTSGNVVKIQSCSLVPGNIPTPPAPQSIDEVLRECRYYYEKSMQPSQAGSVAANLVYLMASLSKPASNIAEVYASPCYVPYATPKRVSPSVVLYGVGGTAAAVTPYISYANGANVFTESLSADINAGTYWRAIGSGSSVDGVNGFSLYPLSITPIASTNASSGTNTYASGAISFSFIADARIGVV